MSVNLWGGTILSKGVATFTADGDIITAGTQRRCRLSREFTLYLCLQLHSFVLIKL